VRRRGGAGQVQLLLLVVGGCSWFLATQAIDYLFSTVALLLVVATPGLALINRLSGQLHDRNLQRLGYLFLLKIPVLLALAKVFRETVPRNPVW